MTTQATFDCVPDEAEKQPEKAAAPKKPRQNTGNHPDPMEQQAKPVEGEIMPPESKTETGSALAIVEQKSSQIVSVFSQEKGLDPVIEEIKRRVESETFDVTTEKGRKRIGSVARDIGEAKMEMKRMAQNLTEDWRTRTKAVTSETSRMEKEMDALRDKILAPREEFEKREADRVDGHKQRLAQMADLSSFPDPDFPPTSAAVQARIDRLVDFNGLEWQEFTESAKAAREKVEAQLSDLFVRTKKAEDDAAELARLRKAEEDRLQKERDDKIAADAAAEATRIAEKKAADEKAEADRIAKEEQDRLKREKDEADARAKKAEEERVAAHQQAVFKMAELAKVPEPHTSGVIQSRLDTIKIIYDREWQEFKPQADEIYTVASKNMAILFDVAVKREADIAEKLRKDAAEKAAQDERDRVAEEQRKQKEIDDKRAADTKHKAKINNEILTALKAIGMMDDQGWKDVITAIAQGKIPHTSIKY